MQTHAWSAIGWIDWIAEYELIQKEKIEMPDFDKLHDLASKLVALTRPQDRQEGLSTWCAFVSETWGEISAMWEASPLDTKKPAPETIAFDVVTFSNNVISTQIPRFELIPLTAATALALRFEYGVRLKKAQAWNALQNQGACNDTNFVIDRLSHTIHHCLKAISAIAEGRELDELEDGGDAGAIMFGGAVLAAFAATLPGKSANPMPRPARHAPNAQSKSAL